MPVEALVLAAKAYKVAKLAKAVSDTKKLLAKRWAPDVQKMTNQCLLETSQIGATVAIALIAARRGKPPTSKEVQAELKLMISDPDFVHRLYRSFSEMLKTPSAPRRRRLAAVLFAGPSITKEESDRDRLDRLAERLGEEDIWTLKQVAEFRNRGLGDSSRHVWLYRSDGVVTLSNGHPDGGMMTESRIVRSEAIISPAAIDDLVGAGCLLRGARIGEVDNYPMATPLDVTELGEFFLGRMEHEAIRSVVGT